MWIKTTCVSLKTSHTALKKKKNSVALPSWLLQRSTLFIHFSYFLYSFSDLVFLSFCWLPICRILPECWSSFFSPFWFVPRGVSAVADPFLKIRVAKSALILTWQSHKPSASGTSLAAACASRGRWGGKGTWGEGRGSVPMGQPHYRFCPYNRCSTERQTSLKQKIALVIYFLTHLQNSVLPREGNM